MLGRNADQRQHDLHDEKYERCDHRRGRQAGSKVVRSRVMMQQGFELRHHPGQGKYVPGNQWRYCEKIVEFAALKIRQNSVPLSAAAGLAVLFIKLRHNFFLEKRKARCRRNGARTETFADAVRNSMIAGQFALLVAAFSSALCRNLTCPARSPKSPASGKA